MRNEPRQNRKDVAEAERRRLFLAMVKNDEMRGEKIYSENVLTRHHRARPACKNQNGLFVRKNGLH